MCGKSFIFSYKINNFFKPLKTIIFAKFGDDDGPNLFRVNKIVVSSTFY